MSIPWHGVLGQGQPQCCVWSLGLQRGKSGTGALGVTMGGDRGGLWAHCHFPSHREYFSQGYLAWRQGRNAL